MKTNTTKFEIGDTVLLSNPIKTGGSWEINKYWLTHNPLAVGKIVEIETSGIFPIKIRSYSKDNLICNERELTLVSREEKQHNGG